MKKTVIRLSIIIGFIFMACIMPPKVFAGESKSLSVGKTKSVLASSSVETGYLTFSSSSEFTIELKKTIEFEYSTDLNDWTQIGYDEYGTTMTAVQDSATSKKYVIYLRNSTSKTHTGISSAGTSTFLA